MFHPPPAQRKKKRRQNRHPPDLHIRDTEWFADCSNILSLAWSRFSAKTAPNALCLGLGSITDSPVSRIQFAFLVETCRVLNIASGNVFLYDPVFTPADHALIRENQMTVLSNETSANYVLDAPTLCFMPHCELELYEAILSRNWSKERLSNMFLVGNSFQAYLDAKPERLLKQTAPYLLRAAPFLQNDALPESSAWPTAFNNTSMQFFLAMTTEDEMSLFAEPLTPMSRSMVTADDG